MPEYLKARSLLRGWKKAAAGVLDACGALACLGKNGSPFNREEVESILLIRLDHIGDVVMSTVLLGHVRRLFPNAEIEVMVKPHCLPLLENNPDINRAFAYAAEWTRREGDAGASADSGDGRRYDLVISPRGDYRDNRLAAELSQKWAVGFDVRGGGHFLSHVAGFDPNAHQTRREEELLRVLGLEVAGKFLPRIDLSETEKENGAEFLRNAGIDPAEKFVLINPGAASPLKMWPTENFAKVAEILRAEKIPVAVISGPLEEKLQELVVRESGVAGLPQMTLREFAAVNSFASAVLCNDSGPMHIANAVGTKVAVIFGPTMERITGPLGEGNIVLKGFDRPEWFPGTPSPAPEKCVRSLAAVTPEMAAEAVRKLLE